MKRPREYSKTLKERFDSKWVPEPNSGCWLWLGTASLMNYGRIKQLGRLREAHRVSWELHKGHIPKGMCVCHRCDTPLCVNPNHLFTGYSVDNVRDMDNKDRRITTPGERNGMSKLTSNQVISIRKAKGSQRKIARQYQISQMQVHRIKARKDWRHLHAAA